MQKALKYIAMGILVLNMLPIAVANAAVTATFADVTDATPYRAAIIWSVEQGVTQGYDNGLWGPDDCVKRAEIVKMIIESGPGGGPIGISGVDPNFSDVSTTDWYYKYIKEAKFLGIISGYSDGTFKPNNCVNRAEAMKIVANAKFSESIDFKSNSQLVMYDGKIIVDIEVNAWFAPYARRLFQDRIVGMVHTKFDKILAGVISIKFYPGEPMSRKEVVEMLKNVNTLVNAGI